MANLDTFLEQLKGAGLTIPSAEELGDEAKQLLIGLADKDNALAQALEDKKRAEDGYSGVTKDNSAKDRRIKELEAQVSKAPDPAPAPAPEPDGDFAAVLAKQSLEWESKLDQVLEVVNAQKTANEALEAQVKRRELLDSLAAEFDVLADPKYHSLIPQTADEEALRKTAQTLTDLRTATEISVVNNMRDGVIPSTAPPRVMPGRPETLEREIANIERARSNGEISAKEAGSRMDQAMESFNTK